LKTVPCTTGNQRDTDPASAVASAVAASAASAVPPSASFPALSASPVPLPAAALDAQVPTVAAARVLPALLFFLHLRRLGFVGGRVRAARCETKLALRVKMNHARGSWRGNHTVSFISLSRSIASRCFLC
jgi:hypothetical protein